MTPQIATGELVFNSKHWKIYRQDAGMGDKEYALFLNDEFFARTDDNRRALIIHRACGEFLREP